MLVAVGSDRIIILYLIIEPFGRLDPAQSLPQRLTIGKWPSQAPKSSLSSSQVVVVVEITDLKQVGAWSRGLDDKNTGGVDFRKDSISALGASFWRPPFAHPTLSSTSLPPPGIPASRACIRMSMSSCGLTRDRRCPRQATAG